jgi:MFS family permease
MAPPPQPAARPRTQVESPSAFVRSLRLLATRRFGTFCVASLLSNLGTWAQQVAEPWLLLTLGASSVLIGIDSFALAAPVWILTLVGGVLADRTDRRRTITVCQSIQMLCPVTLVALIATGTVVPWMVIGLSTIVGITDALSMPSFASIVPSIVERREIAAALALNATQFNLSRILGPAVAGVLMASIGAIGCFALNAASYVPFIWVAIWILPKRPRPRAGEEAFDRRSFFAGIAEIARTPELSGALLTVIVTSTLCGPLIVFCPVLVKTVLNGSVGDFSISVAGFGVGGVLGAVALLGIDPARDRRKISAAAAAAYGAMIIAVAFNPSFTFLPILLALAGIAMTVSNTSANAILQAESPERLRGRIVSLYQLAMRGGLSIGSLLTGLSVSGLGVRQALFVNGLIAVAAQIAVGRHWLSGRRRSETAPGPTARPRAAVAARQGRDAPGRAASPMADQAPGRGAAPRAPE